MIRILPLSKKGSGLGLATAYSTVKRHGGQMSVYSEIGKGAVFNIYLPASLGWIKDAADIKQPTHQGLGRILIMDDQTSILRMVARMLTLMGYEIKTTNDGAKAIYK